MYLNSFFNWLFCSLSFQSFFCVKPCYCSLEQIDGVQSGNSLKSAHEYVGSHLFWCRASCQRLPCQTKAAELFLKTVTSQIGETPRSLSVRPLQQHLNDNFPPDWPELEWLSGNSYLTYRFQAGDPRDGFYYAALLTAPVDPLSQNSVSVQGIDMSTRQCHHSLRGIKFCCLELQSRISCLGDT